MAVRITQRTVSELLFEAFCEQNAVSCRPVQRLRHRTPDYEITLRGTAVICEVKQIDPSAADKADVAGTHDSDASGRWVPNRIRQVLKSISGQLENASKAGQQTLLIIYDNTPLHAYTAHLDVRQAMFGIVSVRGTRRADGSVHVSAPFFGKNKGVGPGWNTSISAIAILEGQRSSALRIRLYPNPFARVPLDPELFDGLPMKLIS